MSALAANRAVGEVVCPACLAAESTRGPHIAIRTQHASYFPHDESVQSQLSQELAAVGSGYDLFSCGVCGLTFAVPMVAPTSGWYQLAYRAWNVTPEERWEYPVVLASLTSRDYVFEIGCGLGTFLTHCRTQNTPAFGIDFSAESIAFCRRKGLDAATFDVGMQAVAKGRSPASVVVSFQVLEHLETPDHVFSLAAEVAADDAVLWVSIPNPSRTSRVLGVSEPTDEPPHHLTKWTEKALEAIGARNGWELDRVLREPFSWRAALYVVVADSTTYRRLRAKGWLRIGAFERAIRLAMYPLALSRLRRHPDLSSMGGLSMIVRYRLRARRPPRHDGNS